jgi:hypothetical protein
MASTLNAMVADAEISPGEAQKQAAAEGVTIGTGADDPPATGQKAADGGGSRGMPTLDQFLKENTKKPKPRSDNSFLQMNQATFDLQDLLGSLGGTTPGAPAVPADPAAPLASGAAPASAPGTADSLTWTPTDDRTLLGLSFLQLQLSPAASAAGVLERVGEKQGSESLHRLAAKVQSSPNAEGMLTALADHFCEAAPAPPPIPVPEFLQTAMKLSGEWAQLASQAQSWATKAQTYDAKVDGLIDDYVAQLESDAAWVKATAAAVPPAAAITKCRDSPARTAVLAALAVLRA